MKQHVAKLEIPLSDDVREELTKLQKNLGLHSLEDLTVHAWEVLCFILQTGNREHRTVSSGDMQWIAHPGKVKPPAELFKNFREKLGQKTIPYDKIDTQILQEIHRLLDDECIDEAIKASQIYKLLKSNSHRKDAVQSEMLLTAAETFANESDPETATQLIIDAGDETSSHMPPQTTGRSGE